MKMVGRFRCWLARRDLTALADGELRPWRAGCVSRHVQRCGHCASFCAEIRRSVEVQRDLLTKAMWVSPDADVVRMLRGVRGRLAESAEQPSRGRVWQPVAVGALAVAALAVFFVVRDVEREPVRAPSLAPGRVAKGPGAASGAGAAARGAGVPAGQDRLAEGLEQQEALARGDRLPGPTHETGAEPPDRQPPEELPSDLLAKPDLFIDYGMMVRLEALENFDHVQSLPETDGLDAQQAG